jgi:hypothetical protein
MADYSLVPVNHRPNFDGYSLVPVDYDPFGADDVTQQAQAQQAQTPQAQVQVQPALQAQRTLGQQVQTEQTQPQPQLLSTPTPTPTPTPTQPQAVPTPSGQVASSPIQPPQAQTQGQVQQPAAGANQPAVKGAAANNAPDGSSGVAGINRFGGPEGDDFPTRNARVGFQSAESAWDAALKEMKELGAQYYPKETKNRGFIPELGVEIFKRDGRYYYDKIARGFQDGALGGGVGFGDSGAVARGHMHWDNQHESEGDRDNARAYSQGNPDYKAWVGSWYGGRLYWHNGKPTDARMPGWNRYKY